MNEMPIPVVRARWPRLLSESDACEYLSIGKTMLRDRGPRPKHLGRRVLYDIKDLDRWASRLDDQPLDEEDRLKEAAHVEDQFFEERRRRGRDRA